MSFASIRVSTWQSFRPTITGEFEGSPLVRINGLEVFERRATEFRSGGEPVRAGVSGGPSFAVGNLG